MTTEATSSEFISGVFNFVGEGYDHPVILQGATYKIPADKYAQPVYVRCGNTTTEVIGIVLMHNDRRMRLVPVGAKSAIHVPLVIVESLRSTEGATPAQIHIGVVAPKDTKGSVLLDLGIKETF